jgi:hypothetical protein
VVYVGCIECVSLLSLHCHFHCCLYTVMYCNTVMYTVIYTVIHTAVLTLSSSLCDASDRARGKTQVVHRRAAQVYMCSGEEGDRIKEEEEV